MNARACNAKLLAAALALASAATLAPAPLRAQADPTAASEPGAPVPLKLAPAAERVPPGAPITLRGSGPVLADAPPGMTVTLPDGTQATAAVTVGAPGRFELVWRDTQRLGRYRFALTLPGQPQTATVEVEVVSAGASLADARSTLEGTVGLAEKTLTGLEARLAKLPLSPARDAGRAKLKALKDGVSAHRGHLREALDQLDRVAQSGNDMPASLGVLSKRLAPVIATSRERRTAIEGQLARSAQEDIACEQMERVTEGLNLASALLNLVGGPLDILINFAKDMDAGALASWATSDAEKQFIDKEITKNATAAEPVAKAAAARFKAASHDLKPVAGVARDEAIKTLPGLAADASAYLTQQLFGRYCERFEGPMQAELDATFFHTTIEQGKQAWWRYKLRLEGKLTLRYAKQAPGSAVRLKGEFIGQATHFETHENALAVLFPKLASSTVKLAKVVDPVGVPYEFRPEGEGKVFSTALVPNTFFIPVEGDMIETRPSAKGQSSGAKLSLRLGPATVDLDANAHVVYLMVSPLTQGLPTWTSFSLPFKPARFVIMRAMNGDAADFEVNRQGDKLLAGKTFKNERGGDEAKGVYSMTLKICNPGC